MNVRSFRANLLFWGVSSWLITSVFSIVRMETTIINDIETSFVERDPDLILFFVVGQLLYAVYFYGLRYAIRNISGKTDIRLFLVKAAAASITFLWLFYLITNQFILIDRAPFPGISFALFGFCWGGCKTLVFAHAKNNQGKSTPHSAPFCGRNGFSESPISVS